MPEELAGQPQDTVQSGQPDQREMPRTRGVPIPGDAPKIKEPHELREERYQRRQQELSQQQQQPAPEKSDRWKRREARRLRVRAMTPEVARVRVTPTSDVFRGAIKHPGGVAFRSTGSAEWPMDQFTKRRLRDGSVTLEGGDVAEQRSARVEAAQNHRTGGQRPGQRPQR
jgi:hypothetical protein